MLSALVQAGAINYLRRIAALRLPEEADRSYRSKHAAKRDALISIMRVFEQMQVKEIACVGRDVFDTLENLKADDTQPMMVQALASKALETWDR